MPRVITKNWLRLLLVFFTAFGVTLIVASVTRYFLEGRAKSEETTVETPTENNENPDDADKTDNPNEAPAAEPPAFIDFQAEVDRWAANTPGNKAVIIYDLDHEKVAASLNPNEVFNMASVYKLFFVYDGYRRISDGSENAANIVADTSDKGQLSLMTCLDLMVRESYNGCADPLRADSERFARVEGMISELGLKNTANAGLYSTASDITDFMKVLWRHEGFDVASWNQLLDSMLNQPRTTYVWRQGLPSGFSTAQVYDKVGWDYTGSYWSTYNEVAFVVFPEQNRHYIVTALTSGLPTFQPLVQLGTIIEDTVLAADTPSIDEATAPSVTE